MNSKALFSEYAFHLSIILIDIQLYPLFIVGKCISVQMNGKVAAAMGEANFSHFFRCLVLLKMSREHYHNKNKPIIRYVQ